MTVRCHAPVPGCELLEAADFRDTLGEAARQGGADLIVTSPPYDDARTYGAAVSWRFADYQALGDAVAGALRPGGHALVVLDGPVRAWRKGFGTERSFTPWRVMLDWAERVGLRVPDRLAYGRHGLPGCYAGRFRNDWEPLLWFQRPGRGHLDKWSIAAARMSVDGGRHMTQRLPDGTLIRRARSGRAHESRVAHRGTWWWYGSVGACNDDPTGLASGHPARFALRFAEDVVRCEAPLGGLVVDPFLGSGTSAVAALRHGRRFLGGDLLVRPADGLAWAAVAATWVARACRPTRAQALACEALDL